MKLSVHKGIVGKSESQIANSKSELNWVIFVLGDSIGSITDIQPCNLPAT